MVHGSVSSRAGEGERHGVERRLAASAAWSPGSAQPLHAADQPKRSIAQ